MKKHGRVEPIAVADIVYIEGAGNDSELVLADGRRELHAKTLEKLADVVTWLTDVSGEDASTLCVAALSEGGSFREFAVREDQIVGLRGDEAVPLPSDTRWALEGDVRRHAGRGFFAAPYWANGAS